MPVITNADLHALSTQIIDAMRREVTLVRDESDRNFKSVHKRIDELSTRQAAQNSHINKHEREIGSLDTTVKDACKRLDGLDENTLQATAKLAALDALQEAKSDGWLGVELSKKQKAAVASIIITAVGAMAEAGRHVVSALFSAVSR